MPRLVSTSAARAVLVALTLIVALLPGATPASAAACAPGEYAAGGGCQPAEPGYWADGDTQHSCGPGSYSPGNVSECIPAPLGRYVSGVAATSAQLCAAGSTALEPGATYCDPAPRGYVSAAGNGHVPPSPCPDGTYQPDEGQSSCLAIPAGSFASGIAVTTVTPCPAGQFQPDPGQASCRTAAAGHAAAGPGATSEVACTAGTYQPAEGQAACLIAPEGTYVALPGSLGTTFCPPRTTSPAGSVSAAACREPERSNGGDAAPPPTPHAPSTASPSPSTASPSPSTQPVAPAAVKASASSNSPLRWTGPRRIAARGTTVIVAAGSVRTSVVRLSRGAQARVVRRSDGHVAIVSRATHRYVVSATVVRLDGSATNRTWIVRP